MAGVVEAGMGEADPAGREGGRLEEEEETMAVGVGDAVADTSYSILVSTALKPNHLIF